MTDDEILKLSWEDDMRDYNGYIRTVPFARALLAAGASEGQADHPLDIRAYIVTDRSSGAKALKWAAELGNRFPSELYQLIPLTHHADAVAELTALRERHRVHIESLTEALNAANSIVERANERNAALRERIAGIRMEALKEARHVVYMALSLNDAFNAIEALVDKEPK